MIRTENASVLVLTAGKSHLSDPWIRYRKAETVDRFVHKENRIAYGTASQEMSQDTQALKDPINGAARIPSIPAVEISQNCLTTMLSTPLRMRPASPVTHHVCLLL